MTPMCKRGPKKSSRDRSGEGCLEVFVGLVVVAFVLAIVFLIGDYLAGTSHTIRGKVVEKYHQSHQTHTGVGYASNSKGRGSVVPVVTSTPEKWEVLVDTEGDAMTVQLDAKDYISLSSGDMVDIGTTRGRWTGNLWGRTYLGKSEQY